VFDPPYFLDLVYNFLIYLIKWCLPEDCFWRQLLRWLYGALSTTNKMYCQIGCNTMILWCIKDGGWERLWLIWRYYLRTCPEGLMETTRYNNIANELFQSCGTCRPHYVNSKNTSVPFPAADLLYNKQTHYKMY
jgi:hypothetical protein